MAKVYIVPIIDTEGPSDCTMKGDLNGVPNWGKLRTWPEIRKNIDSIVNSTFRKSHTDRIGGPIVYSWSWLDWKGFIENPRQQHIGYHGVYDQVHLFTGKRMFGQKLKDGSILHYHHPRPDGSWIANQQYPYEQWNRDFADNDTLADILAHYVVEKEWFPVVFRAGGTVEDNALSAFLEKYIPLDFSSRGDPVHYPQDKGLPDEKLLFDWRGTPNDWSPYHPDETDYKRKGGMQRTIFLSLDHGEQHSLGLLTAERIRNGFERAAAGKDTIISYFSHDFVPELSHVMDEAHHWIQGASARNPGVEWHYATALDAVKNLEGKESSPPQIGAVMFHDYVKIIASKPVFGIPFAATRSKDGEIKHHELTKEQGYYALPAEGLPEEGRLYISVTDTAYNNTIDWFHIQGKELRRG